MKTNSMGTCAPEYPRNTDYNNKLYSDTQWHSIGLGIALGDISAFGDGGFKAPLTTEIKLLNSKQLWGDAIAHRM